MNQISQQFLGRLGGGGLVKVELEQLISESDSLLKHGFFTERHGGSGSAKEDNEENKQLHKTSGFTSSEWRAGTVVAGWDSWGVDKGTGILKQGSLER